MRPRWFRPPLDDLTTENDSRIERIVRYDQDSDDDKMIKIETKSAITINNHTNTSVDNNHNNIDPQRVSGQNHVDRMQHF